MIIDYQSPIPIYEQVVREIVIGIARGELKPGETLPSVRKLAEEVGVNLHTIHKAYNQLKDMGYVIVDRRVGVTVADSFGQQDDKSEKELGEAWLYQLADAYNRGIEREEVLTAISKVFDEFERGREDVK